MNVQIIYQDSDFLLCRKPSGMPSQPDSSGQADLLTTLSDSYHDIHLVHRLDTPTGGIMMFAKKQTVATKLCTLVQDHEHFQKEYLAVLAKPPVKEQGSMRDYLYHDKRTNKSFVTDRERKGSKEAILDYRVLAKTDDGHALVLVRLYTGRTHQIRVQFASRGFPLVGDGKYGSREKCPYIGLWAYKLTFPHPKDKKILSFSTKPDTTVNPWHYFTEYINQI